MYRRHMNIHHILFTHCTWGRLIYWFCPEKRPWNVSPRPLPPPHKTSNSKMILRSWCWSPCLGQMGLGQNMLQEPFSWAAIKDEHNQYLLHIFRCNYDIFLQFCLILGWRKSIISISTETSSNKTPTPLNVPGTFLQTKSIKWVFPYDFHF